MQMGTRSRNCCHDHRKPDCTLNTMYMGPVYRPEVNRSITLWKVYCDVCGIETELCLTQGEAYERAAHGIWVNDTPKEDDICE